MEEKVCVTTYVWGDKYQDYVPIAVYSLQKSYPEYDIVLFLHGTLKPSLKALLDKFNLKVTIKENVFADCPQMNSSKAKAFRWVLWDDSFLSYDYIYTIDIDMFYIKEPLSLHLQHIYHMKNITNLPFDNMRRIVSVKDNCLINRVFDLCRFCKKNGIKSRYIPNYLSLFKNSEIVRLSGLHFVNVKDYYGALSLDVLRKYTLEIYEGVYLKGLNVSDEIFLYRMLHELGFNVNRLAVQKLGQYEHLDFNNYDKELFRPTHGVHLGVFRGEKLAGWQMETLLMPHEIYYKEYIQNELLANRDFIEFIQSLEDAPKLYFKKYFDFHRIDASFLN